MDERERLEIVHRSVKDRKLGCNPSVCYREGGYGLPTPLLERQVVDFQYSSLTEKGRLDIINQFAKNRAAVDYPLGLSIERKPEIVHPSANNREVHRDYPLLCRERNFVDYQPVCYRQRGYLLHQADREGGFGF